MTPLLHSALVAGAPLRFVASPLPKPDLPWHVVEDLHAALGLHRSVRRQLVRGLRANRRWAQEARTGRFGPKVLTIASHALAQGLLAAMAEAGVLPAGVVESYHAAAVEAFDVEAAALHLNAHQRAARLLEAATGKPQPGVPVRIDTDTGEAVYGTSELQRALGLSEDEMADKVAELEDLGLARTVHPSKLASVQ